MSLTGFSAEELSQLRSSVDRDRLREPFDKTSFSAAMLQRYAAAADVLAGLQKAAALRLLDAVLAERDARAGSVDLVWTGPEADDALALSTEAVVRRLFSEAQESVLVGGYSFVNGKKVLEPLCKAISERGVTARLFIDVDIPRRLKIENDREAAAQDHIRQFLAKTWDTSVPVPEIYFDARALVGDEYTSLHAKCIVVDHCKTLITSANFTNRGHTRNIEVGVVVPGDSLAKQLELQWNGLVASGLVRRY